MKIAFFSTKDYDRTYFDRYNSGHIINYYENRLDMESIALADGHDAICAFVNDKLDVDVIRSLVSKGIKLILLRCAGFNNVNLKIAKESGIKVFYVPEYSPHAVAEHTIALLLCLNRKIHKAYNRVREGNFSLSKLMGFDLYQKTVGVIGCGRIGKALVSILLGFGCKVLVNSLEEDHELTDRGVRFVSREEVFRNSDVISLQCPLNDATHHMINKDSIGIMKKGVFLVNTSRGALIDTVAAKEGLQSGQIGALAIDVYEQEQHLFFHDLSDNIINDSLILELMMYPNVIITAHQGFFTDEALTQIAQVTYANLDDFKYRNYSNELTGLLE